jgi:hypothetical protein
MKKAAKSEATYREMLLRVDSKYFDYEADEKLTLNDAAYSLATWIFDHNDDKETARKRIKKFCSPELYLLALEKYLDGEHDT